MDLQSFKEWLLVNGSEQASAETHCSKVASFFRNYESFTQENLNSFFASKIDKWVANSFNININAFNHYAKFLKLEIEIPKYHKKKKKDVEPYLSEKDFYDIVTKIPLIFKNSDKAQAIAILMFQCGLRPKEVCQLKRADFNFTEKIVLIKDTKTDTDRVAVLSNSLCDMLPAIFAQEAEVDNAFNIRKHNLNYICQRINEMMGLKVKIKPYSLRHGFAHDMINKGLDLNSLKVMMGHSSINTTLGYLDVTEKEAQEKVRKLINKRRKR